MAKLNRRSISRRTVEALKVDKDTVFWDRDLPGFGVRVYASGAKMYVVQSRAKGKSVRVTVGRHGVITADEARRRAARIVNRIKAGEEPVAEPLPARLAGGPTVADLVARYMEEHVAVRCKDSTAEGMRKLVDKHILPAFGKLPLLAVERERVVVFHARLSGVPYAANRAVALLSRMYRAAAAWGMVPDGTNPCRGIGRHRERRRERFLTDTEFRRLGTVLGRGGGRRRGVGPCGGGNPAVVADRVPQERDPVLELAGRGSRGGRDPARRQQDWSARGAAVVAGGPGAGGAAEARGQSPGSSPARSRART